ncbi:hypothetical protein R3P38DRAFT_2804467 [Favolaschia claudopus]|uniref:Uncharacterized protein n=1 Tax=Favolaschia claudopus TaxID=2862362 RepID=A0AAV9ZRH3_9AGAR
MPSYSMSTVQAINVSGICPRIPNDGQSDNVTVSDDSYPLFCKEDFWVMNESLRSQGIVSVEKSRPRPSVKPKAGDCRSEIAGLPLPSKDQIVETELSSSTTVQDTMTLPRPAHRKYHNQQCSYIERNSQLPISSDLSGSPHAQPQFQTDCETNRRNKLVEIQGSLDDSVPGRSRAHKVDPGFAFLVHGQPIFRRWNSHASKSSSWHSAKRA